MKLENKWKQKKAEGDFKSKAGMTALEMKNASFKEYYKRTAEEISGCRGYSNEKIGYWNINIF